MNHWTGIGRLTRDPELRYTGGGKAVTNFTIAIDRPGQKKETDFIDIVTWDKTAENVSKYVTKGRLVAVEGRLQIRSYDAQDGSKRKASEIVASNVTFLGSGKKGSGEVEDDSDVPF